MTPIRWLIVAFWAFVIIMCGKSLYDYNSRVESAATVQVEQHEYAPLLPGAQAAPQSQAQDADVRQVGYVPKEDPNAALFTADLTIKNFGQKTATGIQVRVLPYVGTSDGSTQQGPDEINNPGMTDQMATQYQWVEFPDLPAGQSETKTLTFPVRTDAEPRSHFEPKITFVTVKDSKA